MRRCAISPCIPTPSMVIGTTPFTLDELRYLILIGALSLGVCQATPSDLPSVPPPTEGRQPDLCSQRLLPGKRGCDLDGVISTQPVVQRQGFGALHEHICDRHTNKVRPICCERSLRAPGS